MHQRNPMSRKAQKRAHERARRRRQGIKKARGDQHTAMERFAAWERKNPTKAREKRIALQKAMDRVERVYGPPQSHDNLLDSLKASLGL